MAESARVLSTDALKGAKAALAEFAEDVAATLAGVDSDIARVSHWISHDRLAHWKREHRRREDGAAHARSEIMRKQIIAAPEPASVVDERRAYERAKRRVEEADRKLAAVRRWAPVWEREALLYKGSCQPLAEAIHRDVPIAMARLERMLSSLEAYGRLAPPRAEGKEGAAESDAGAPLKSDTDEQGGGEAEEGDARGADRGGPP